MRLAILVLGAVLSVPSFAGMSIKCTEEGAYNPRVTYESDKVKSIDFLGDSYSTIRVRLNDGSAVVLVNRSCNIYSGTSDESVQRN